VLELGEHVIEDVEGDAQAQDALQRAAVLERVDEHDDRADEGDQVEQQCHCHHRVTLSS
jgi:hypothetical protein